VLRTGGAIAGAAGTLALLENLAWVPERVAWADEVAAFPDVQFDLAPFVPPAQTIDGVPVSLPPVHTAFVTARLAFRPTNGDQLRMESALRTIETTYPYSPAGVFTHVAYSDNYFNRLPDIVVAAAMPRTLAGNQPVLKRAVPGPTDVAAGNRVLELRRAEFTVPVRLESNDLLFTVRSDNPGIVADVVDWLSGSDSLKGHFEPSPRFFAGMTITSSRAMFVQRGLPRSIANSQRLPFATFVNPSSPMWMGFADQQVDASAPAQNVTFVGGGGIKLTNSQAGNYFDNGSIQHLSHVLLDLQQFYVDGRDPDEAMCGSRSASGCSTCSSRRSRCGRTPTRSPTAAARATWARGVRSCPTCSAAPGTPGRARSSSAGWGTSRSCTGPAAPATGNRSTCASTGPGSTRWTPPPAATRRSCSSPGSSRAPTSSRRSAENQASVDLLDEFALEEEDHGIERFITATRRQNYLIPPRRHRAFPLIEFT
jgi:hypothetical protein